MKFSEFPYERPNIDELKNEYTQAIESLKKANTLDEAIDAIETYHKISDESESIISLAYIRHSLNTKDPFYDEEQTYLNEKLPELQALSVHFSNTLLSSPLRKELEIKYGKLLFDQAEIAQKIFHPEIIPLLQAENKTTTEYGKLTSSAQIEFEGNIYNLSQMTPLTSHQDRDTRKRAHRAVSNWFQENESKFDEIYDKLVQTRHEIAVKLGFENFIPVAYLRMSRLDYDHNDVKTYRDQVYEEIVPYVQTLMARRQVRLGLDQLHYYDTGLSFKSGNPKPKGNRDWQVTRALKMYDEMHPQTGQFFRYMVDKELLELDSKPGKEGGGYCTYLPYFEAPFIFANFNGTQGDVDVLTHEAGHAYQVYRSRNLIPEYRWPTMEAAEIHSMSMEFLAWPWMHLFFEEDTEKYQFSHLTRGIEFLPYGVLVDAFQHEVFNNPTMTPAERKATWRRLEKKYVPWKDYREDAFLDQGTFWFRQGHIFSSPFYYIDYTLAQVVAFQFWGLAQKDFKAAWEKYDTLCGLGGSKSFVDLIASAKLLNPFKKGTIKTTMAPLKAYLDAIDDDHFK